MRLTILVLFALLPGFLFAQNLHLGFTGGLSNYQGDLVSGAFSLQQTKASVGVSLSYELNDNWMVRSGITFGKVAGHDKFQKDQELKFRNLSFESKIFEASLMGEYSIQNIYVRRWTPYFFGGLAIFRFNPYTFDSTGMQVHLKPLSTEGQGLTGYEDRKPYSLTQVSMPFGGGVRYAVTDNFRIGIEMGVRKTFTDYLDDVSHLYADQADLLAQRGPQAVSLSYREDEVPGGDPTYPSKADIRGGVKSKDYYYFTGLHLQFRINSGGSSFRPGSKRGQGCPTNPL